MLGSTSWWSYDGLTFASFLLHQCATSRTFHHPGKPLLNLDIFSSLDIHPHVAILLHGSMQCARITASLGVDGCCWRGVWVWAHWAPAMAYSEALSFPSSRYVPLHLPCGEKQKRKEGSSLQLFCSERPHTNRGDLTKLPTEQLLCWALRGLLKSSSFL